MSMDCARLREAAIDYVPIDWVRLIAAQFFFSVIFNCNYTYYKINE